MKKIKRYEVIFRGLKIDSFIRIIMDELSGLTIKLKFLMGQLTATGTL